MFRLLKLIVFLNVGFDVSVFYEVFKRSSRVNSFAQ